MNLVKEDIILFIINLQFDCYLTAIGEYYPTPLLLKTVK